MSTAIKHPVPDRAGEGRGGGGERGRGGEGRGWEKAGERGKGNSLVQCALYFGTGSVSNQLHSDSKGLFA